jgi:ubiquinone/menaquinone biosynthesis C-methylase UbiE
MKQGNYTSLAKYYVQRAGYSDDIIDLLVYKISQNKSSFKVAEIGAGTGKLTKQLLKRGLNVVAVEPNDSMREEGIKFTSEYDIEWLKGTAETTGLSDNTYDWVIMASSFHWTDATKSLPEFSRILKDKGYLTTLWNPRDIQRSQIEMKVEEIIYDKAPNIKRKSSGASKYTQEMDDLLLSTDNFVNPIFLEARHKEIMEKERYIDVWKSVNDVQVQAGPENWEKILVGIKAEIKNLDTVTVAYKTRAWLVQKK